MFSCVDFEMLLPIRAYDPSDAVWVLFVKKSAITDVTHTGPKSKKNEVMGSVECLLVVSIFSGIKGFINHLS